jgi:hypothetical protein
MPEAAADPRIIRLVQQVDQERRARIAAERKASALRAVIAKMQKQRTTDAKAERVSC